MPSSPGLGMHVEIRDPDDKVLLSRVSIISFLLLYFIYYILQFYLISKW